MKYSLRRIICGFLALMVLLAVSLSGASAATYIIDSGFKITRDAGNVITIHGYVGSDENVSVPSTLLSQTVTGVYEYAFMDNTLIKSVTMPTTITTVDRGAFYGCTNLESVQLPKNCTQIGQYMFYGCSSLTSVTMPNVLKEVPRYCFSHCDSLETVTLPSTAKVIGEYAFSDCPNLKSVYVSKYTNSIAKNAFEDSPQVVIYGYMNTYAHEYAMENAIPFCAVDANAQTLYVTFYNYDGTVFLRIPVSKGGSVIFPSVEPEKPETDTHYYEFAYWDGSIINIQENESLYPVFNEIEKKPAAQTTYSVVFLGADDVFVNVQNVIEGQDAMLPEANPQKASTQQYDYTFIGWDTDHTNVTENRVIRPVFEEKVREYTVSFTDINNNVIENQTVAYGTSAEAPEAPQVSGYTFKGWDAAFDYVTENITVKAIYEKIQEVSVPATGTLKIDVSGGTGFNIAVENGLSRPQGATYLNSKIPVGTAVTVTAMEVSGARFLGWVNIANNIILTTDYSYTFFASGNDSLKAVYSTDVEGVQMVSFVNDKVGVMGRFLDVQYYSSVDEIAFPEAPTQVGFDFAGWNMTVEQIKSMIAAGEDVTVLATWTRQVVYINVTVNGGTGGGICTANSAVVITANEAPAGQKFAYWTDAQGNVRSYSKVYEFYTANDIELTAVFVSVDAEIDYRVLTSVDSIDTVSVEDKNIFYYSWCVPDELGVTFVKAGIIAVSKDKYNSDTFYAGTADSNVYDRGPSALEAFGAYTWSKSNVSEGQTWVAKAYVQYKDATGALVTVYSDPVEATK